MSRHYHKRSTQLTINDILTIPEDKPDIEFLLRVTATPVINKGAGAEKTINFSGHILICIEYVAGIPDDTQPIHFVSFELPFEEMLRHRHMRPEMNAQLKGLVEIPEFQRISPRNIKILINFKVYSLRLARANKPLPPHLCKPYTNLCNQ
ncbi:DUF3794 domain-containing protein [Sporomusa termitida]|uniref:SipL SPOCS domain-containing protein n=1 Tax=Sporomusa termitida TaxID=2377 RepID=A0A517DZL8_9FIRM|nr:DUF3794 domain-containing protein [Sporomusa termitida]QDR82805.1 hypothetical protein SPTER_42360 [Sporomusa termitida]